MPPFHSIHSFPDTRQSINAHYQHLLVYSSSLCFLKGSYGTEVIMSEHTIRMSAFIQILLHQLLGSLHLPVTVQGNHLDSQVILHHLVETTMALNDRGSILQARNLNNGTFSIQFTGKKAGYFPTRFYIITTDGSCIMGCLYLSVEEDNRDMRTISSLDGRCYIIHIIRSHHD